jgi:hypothetical protein
MKPQNFTKHQLAWARAHNWFAFATPHAVYAWSIVIGYEPRIEKLTSFQSLRDWAGY